MKKLNINKKELPAGVLIGIMVIYSIMPIVGRFFSDILSTYAYMLMLLVLTALVVFEKGMKTIEYFVLLILPLLLWKVLEYFGGYGLSFSVSDIIMWGYGVLLDFLPVIVAVYIMKNHERLVKPIAVVLFVACVVTALTSTIYLYVEPDAARFLATTYETDDPRFRLLGWMNVGGYTEVYTMLLLYPLVIYAFKRKKIHAVTAIAIALILLFFILRSQYTIALLLFMVTSVLFFTKKNLTSKNVWLMLGISVVLIFVLWSFVSAGLELLAKNIESKEISNRLMMLSGGVDGLAHGEDRRWSIYWMSLNTIFRYPLIGGFWFGAKIGGHSFLLDFFANWGILGAFAMFVVYRKIYNMFYKPYRHDEGFGYILWIFLQTLFLSLVNTGVWIAVIGFFVPILLCFIENKRDIKSIRLKIKE